MSKRQPAAALPALSASSAELLRMMQAIENEILPKTREGVAAGNKVRSGYQLLYRVCV